MPYRARRYAFLFGNSLADTVGTRPLRHHLDHGIETELKDDRLMPEWSCAYSTPAALSPSLHSSVNSGLLA